MTVLHVILIILLFAVMGIGMISIVFGLPGTIIEFGAVLLFVVLTKAHFIGWYSVLAIGLLTIIAELGETLFGIKDARKAGVSRKAMTASIIGAIAGSVIFAPFLLGIGAIIGAVLGAFTGAFAVSIAENRKAADAVHKGWASAVGRLKGTIFKGIIAITMIIICAAEIL